MTWREAGDDAATLAAGLLALGLVAQDLATSRRGTAG
jgi:hypothetical protein